MWKWGTLLHEGNFGLIRAKNGSSMAWDPTNQELEALTFLRDFDDVDCGFEGELVIIVPHEIQRCATYALYAR